MFVCWQLEIFIIVWCKQISTTSHLAPRSVISDHRCQKRTLQLVPDDMDFNICSQPAPVCVCVCLLSRRSDHSKVAMCVRSHPLPPSSVQTGSHLHSVLWSLPPNTQKFRQQWPWLTTLSDFVRVQAPHQTLSFSLCLSDTVHSHSFGNWEKGA